MASAEKAPKIYEAISNVMKDVGVIGKDSTNDFDHYKFRGIDAVMNALNPAMIKHRVFVTPTVLDVTREERAGKNGTQMMYTVLTVKYTFYTDDGTFIESVVVGEAMDRSDKSTNKAMSAAFKYACFQTFCIPTEEMLDADAESPEIGQKVTTQSKKTTRIATKEEDFSGMNPPEEVDKDLIPEEGKLVTAAQIAKLKAEMDRTGVSLKQVLAIAKTDTLEQIKQTTFVAIMVKFSKTSSKQG